MLNKDLERYVELKRSLGFGYKDHYRELKHYVAFAQAHGDTFVRIDRAIEYASRAPSLKRCQIRLIFIRGFATAMRAEDPRYEIPPANALGNWIGRRPKPYIYTQEEILNLMMAASELLPVLTIRPLTYSTLFGLLAVTGMRISEALALQVDDFTDDGLIIRQTKFKKSRLLPLHKTTRQALNSYLSARKKFGRVSNDLLIVNTGKAPAYVTVQGVFQKLAISIGLRSLSDQRGPRIHDLRHTFAVRNLEQCQHTKETVGRHIVALSTYLGHSNFANTYWYLEATPHLMMQISTAGETLYKGQPQ